MVIEKGSHQRGGIQRFSVPSRHPRPAQRVQRPVCVRIEKGWTLLEMVIAIAIIGLIAVIATPSLLSTDQHKLDMVVGEFADALRFARQESIRTGIPHGVIANVPADQYQVFRLDLGTVPATWVFDVYHPVAKQSYIVNVNTGLTRGVTISQASMTFTTTCNTPSGLVFGASGNPICTNPMTSPLASAQVSFSQHGVDKIVVVNPMTGRVTLQ